MLLAPLQEALLFPLSIWPIHAYAPLRETQVLSLHAQLMYSATYVVEILYFLLDRFFLDSRSKLCFTPPFDLLHHFMDFLLLLRCIKWSAIYQAHLLLLHSGFLLPHLEVSDA